MSGELLSLADSSMMMGLGKRAISAGPRSLGGASMVVGIGKRSSNNKNKNRLWMMRAIRLSKHNFKGRPPPPFLALGNKLW